MSRTLDELRALAERAKAWRPDVHDAYSTPSEGVRSPLAHEGDCDGHQVGVDEYGDAVVEQCSGCRPCTACLGAERAVEDINRHVCDAVSYAASLSTNPGRDGDTTATKLSHAEYESHCAARIASYFCSEPNDVSRFRDAVKEMCK